LAICLMVTAGFSQNIVRRDSRPAAVAEKLREHGVSLTREGLVTALRSEDPEVRSLAAAQLAFYEGAKETIPDIRAALERESDSLAKVNIAYALAQLGDQDGFEALRAGCFDSKIVPRIRLFAAGYLLNLRRGYCVTAALDILQDSDSPADKMQALSLLPQFGDLSEKDAVRMRALVFGALQDPTPAVRISAGQVIAAIGDETAEASVRAAIEREGDEVVRSELQSDLRRLRKKHGEK